MKAKVIVRNSRVLSEYFNIPLETGEDLLKRPEKKIKDFIEANKEILFKANYDQFEVLFQKTGIFISREYKNISEVTTAYLDECGIKLTFDDSKYEANANDLVSKSHLTIYIEVKRFYSDSAIRNFYCEGDDVYAIIEGKKEAIYIHNEKYDELICDRGEISWLLYTEDLTLEEKIKEIIKKYPDSILKDIPLNKIKRVESIGPSKDLFVLTNNGELYVNNYHYANNVRDICELTSYRTYLIYNNDTTELYVYHLPYASYPLIENNKKVVFNNDLTAFFIAMLDNDKNLFLSTLPFDEPSSCDIDDCIDLHFTNVDDISYTIDEGEEHGKLIISSENGKIDLTFCIFLGR